MTLAPASVEKKHLLRPVEVGSKLWTEDIVCIIIDGRLTIHLLRTMASEVHRKVNKIQSARHACVEFGYLFHHETTLRLAGIFFHGWKPALAVGASGETLTKRCTQQVNKHDCCISSTYYPCVYGSSRNA